MSDVADTPAQSDAPPSYAFLVAMIALAFLTRASNLPYHLTRPLNSDAALFLAEARNHVNGTGSLDPLWSPLYPLASALLAGGGGDLELAALALALISGTLGCVPVYFLGRAMLGERPACFAALGTSVLFPLVFWSCQAYSETLFILCLYSLLLAFRAIRTTHSPAGALGCGLLAGLAYLARPEGFLYGLLLLLGLAVSSRELPPGRRLVPLLLAAGGFFTLTAPPMLSLRAQLGHWTVSGKAGWNLLAGDRALGADYDKLAWSLTADGKELACVQAMRELTLGSLVASRPGELAHRYVANSLELARQILQSAGPVVFALALAGAICMLAAPADLALLAGAASPLIALPLFFVNERFLIFALPVLLLLAARGAEWAMARLVRSKARQPLLWVLLAVFAFVPHLQTAAGIGVAGATARPGARVGDELRQVGLWMRDHCPPGSRTTNVWVGYHSGLTSVQLPLAPLGPTLAYLCAKQCNYLVVDRRHAEKGWLPESSPAFAFLLKDAQLPSGLKEIHRWNLRPEHEVRVFEISCQEIRN